MKNGLRKKDELISKRARMILNDPKKAAILMDYILNPENRDKIELTVDDYKADIKYK